MKGNKQNTEEQRKSRRSFVKKASTGVALGLAGGIMLGTPRRAEAIVWEIPAAVAEYFRLGKYYYETYVEEWVDKINELKDVFNNDDPTIPAILAQTDAANHVRTSIENMRLKRESQPQPSDQCAGENASQGAELMSQVHNDLAQQKSSDSMKELKRVATDQKQYQYQLVKEINESVSKTSLEETLESLNGIIFVGNKGYQDPQVTDQFHKAIMARARLAMSEAGGVNKREMTFAANIMSRLSVAEHALTKVMTRRIPTKAAFERAHDAALPYEKEILQSMKVNEGLSQVDIENFESRRTHESLTWHELVEDNSSATAMSKELALLQAASNDIDVKIDDTLRLINELKSVRTLNETEANSHPKKRNSSVSSTIQFLHKSRNQ